MSGLVLTRKQGERVLIGDDIVIKAVKCRHNAVQLCIDAPRDIRVDREEVRQRIDAGDDPELPAKAG